MNAPTRWTIAAQTENNDKLLVKCNGNPRGLSYDIPMEVLVRKKQGYTFTKFLNDGMGLNASSWSCHAVYETNDSSCKNESGKKLESSFKTLWGENVFLEVTEDENKCLSLSKSEWSEDVERSETPFEGEAFEHPEDYSRYDFNNFTVGISKSVNSAYGSFNCTGVLVAPRTILTAAHCLKKAKGFTITFANNNLRQTIITSKDFMIHPDYSGTSKGLSSRYDAALIFIDRDARGFIPLEASAESPEIGDEVEMVGYGYLGRNKKTGKFIPNKRRELDGLKAKILRKETEKGLLIYQNDKGLSSCAGDSGGPMVEKNEETGDFELVGITRGPVIGDKDSEYCTYRGEYTDYQFIRDWVEDKLR